MTATQRIRSMLDGSPVKEIGACGWLHPSAHGAPRKEQGGRQ